MTPNTDGSPKGQAQKSWYVETVLTITRLKKTSTPLQLVNKGTDKTVAEPHSRKRSSIFRKPRDMSFEISESISHAVDVVLLTFILVWKERERERSKTAPGFGMEVPYGPITIVPGLGD